MGKVSVSELQAGMVLASAAVSNDNRLLLRCGTTLTEKNLRVLKAWGMIEVDVEGVSHEDITAKRIARVDPKEYTAVQRQMKHLFSHTDQRQAPVAELLYICTLRKLDNLIQGK